MFSFLSNPATSFDLSFNFKKRDKKLKWLQQIKTTAKNNFNGRFWWCEKESIRIWLDFKF